MAPDPSITTHPRAANGRRSQKTKAGIDPRACRPGVDAHLRRTQDSTAFGRLDRQLDGLQQTIRFSDYGASGLFDPVKINEPELERLYAFDLGIVEDVAAVEQAIAAVPAPQAPGDAGGAGAALDRVRDLVHVLDDKWRQRRQVISQAVQSAQPV